MIQLTDPHGAEEALRLSLQRVESLGDEARRIIACLVWRLGEGEVVITDEELALVSPRPIIETMLLAEGRTRVRVRR